MLQCFAFPSEMIERHMDDQARTTERNKEEHLGSDTKLIEWRDKDTECSDTKVMEGEEEHEDKSQIIDT